MKVCVIQPPYSMRGEDLRFCEEKLFSLLDECDESLDLIVLPEYSDNLANITKQEDFLNAIKEYNGLLIEKARATAKRCNALVLYSNNREWELAVVKNHQLCWWQIALASSLLFAIQKSSSVLNCM